MGTTGTSSLDRASGQELADLTFEAFDLADKYRTPVIILGDGMLGQMMEPVEFPPEVPLKKLPQKDWTLDRGQGKAKPDPPVPAPGSRSKKKNITGS